MVRQSIYDTIWLKQPYSQIIRYKLRPPETCFTVPLHGILLGMIIISDLI